MLTFVLNPLPSGHHSLVLFDLKGGTVKERGRYALPGAETLAGVLAGVCVCGGGGLHRCSTREFFAIRGTLFLTGFSSKPWLPQNSKS